MELASLSLFSQAIFAFAALVLFTSFIMLAQTRMVPLIFTFAWRGVLLAVVTTLVAIVSNHPHLYISAALTVVLKVGLIPWLLHRLSVQLNMNYETEQIEHPSLLLLGGAGLVIFSFFIALPIVHLSGLATRNTIAVSIAVVLLRGGFCGRRPPPLRRVDLLLGLMYVGGGYRGRMGFCGRHPGRIHPSGCASGGQSDGPVFAWFIKRGGERLLADAYYESMAMVPGYWPAYW